MNRTLFDTNLDRLKGLAEVDHIRWTPEVERMYADTIRDWSDDEAEEIISDCVFGLGKLPKPSELRETYRNRIFDRQKALDNKPFQLDRTLFSTGSRARRCFAEGYFRAGMGEVMADDIEAWINGKTKNFSPFVEDRKNLFQPHP